MQADLLLLCQLPDLQLCKPVHNLHAYNAIAAFTLTSAHCRSHQPSKYAWDAHVDICHASNLYTGPEAPEQVGVCYASNLYTGPEAPEQVGVCHAGD